MGPAPEAPEPLEPPAALDIEDLEVAMHAVLMSTETSTESADASLDHMHGETAARSHHVHPDQQDHPRWGSAVSVLAAAALYRGSTGAASDDDDGTGLPPRLEGMEFAASPGGSRIMPIRDVQGNIVDAVDWNRGASKHRAGAAGHRARRMQIRFDIRHGAGYFGTAAAALSKAWQSFMQSIQASHVGDAGSTWVFRSMIKTVGAHYGGGVASFFRFVKYILWVNFAMFAVEFFFVLVPGFTAWPAIRRRVLVASNLTCSSFDDANATPFLPPGSSLDSVTIAEVTEHWAGHYQEAFEPMTSEFTINNYLDGRGIMGYSPIFFGGYNAVVQHGSHTYRMDVAYILVFLICFLGLLFSVLRHAFNKGGSQGGSAIFKASPTAPYSTGVFTTWDFSLKSKAAVQSLQLGLFSAVMDANDDIALQKENEAKAKSKQRGHARTSADKELQRIAEHEREGHLNDTRMAVDALRASMEANTNTNGSVKSVKDVAATSKMLKRLEELGEHLELLIEQDETIAASTTERSALVLRRVLGWFAWLLILGVTFTGCGQFCCICTLCNSFFTRKKSRMMGCASPPHRPLQLHWQAASFMLT